MEERRFWTIVGILLVFFVLLFMLGNCSAQDTRRATGRRSPVATPDEECKYVQTPWGTRCSVPIDECSLMLMPMFIQNGKQEVTVKLVTSQSIGDGVTKTIPWSDGGAKRLSIEWEGADLRWVEWYLQHNGEFEEIPAVGCYCNERTGEVVKCLFGILEGKIK